MILNTYNRPDITFVSGKGMKVWDDKGAEYLDLVSGIAVNTLGHCNELIIETVKKQSEKLFHISNLYYTEEQADLAKKLVELSDHSKVFFSNSGTEAVECALKIGKKHGKNLGKTNVLYMKNSFHGRTMGALSVTGQGKYQDQFHPLVSGSIECEFNNIKDIEENIKGAYAVILEPLQGEGGLINADKEYLEKIRELCNENNTLLIFDEVQCGAGRLGTFFAYEKFGVIPDIICMAKGLGGGVPIGAVVVNEKADIFVPGDHGTTYGGNSLVCAVSLEVVKKVEEILVNINEMSNLLKSNLEKLKEKYDFIEEVKGEGLLLGLKLKGTVSEFTKYALTQNTLVVGAGSNVVRIIPPLNITKCNVEEITTKLDAILEGYKEELC